MVVLRRVRTVLTVLIAFVASMSAAVADAPAYNAGMVRLTVLDAVPFDTLVAYPSNIAESAVQAGPFTIFASRDAPIAAETKFPVVLFSHGNGRGGGSPIIHHELIFALARHGFVVIAPFHPGTSQPLLDRPRHIHMALDRVLADTRLTGSLDPDRIAMIGFSFGGAVTLIVGGAVPSLSHLSAYCRDRTNDPRACNGVPASVPSGTADLRKSSDTLPLKALVLLEPFGSMFDRQGLQSVRAAVLLYRGRQSDLAPEGNIFALANALPQPPLQESVQGGHFVFVGPCPTLLQATEQLVCKDAPGVDRAAIQDSVRARVLNFLRSHL